MFENTHTHISKHLWWLQKFIQFLPSVRFDPHVISIWISLSFSFFFLPSLPVVQVVELPVRRSTLQNVVQRGEEAPASNEEEVEKKLPWKNLQLHRLALTLVRGGGICSEITHRSFFIISLGGKRSLDVLWFFSCCFFSLLPLPEQNGVTKKKKKKNPARV